MIFWRYVLAAVLVVPWVLITMVCMFITILFQVFPLCVASLLCHLARDDERVEWVEIALNSPKLIDYWCGFTEWLFAKGIK
jgi:hypothetical protein